MSILHLLKKIEDFFVVLIVALSEVDPTVTDYYLNIQWDLSLGMEQRD